MIRFNNIRQRLRFWFLVVALVPLLTVFAVIYFARVHSIKSMEMNKLAAIRDLKVDQVKDNLKEIEADVLNLAQVPQVRDLLVALGKPPEKKLLTKNLSSVRQQLQNYIKNNLSYSELFVLAADSGRIIVSSKPAMEGENLTARPFFQEPLRTGQLYFTEIYSSHHHHEPTIICSAPVRGVDPAAKPILGILAARINLRDSFYNLLLNRTGMGQTGETLIVNRDGLALSELRWRTDAPLKLKIYGEPALKAIQGATGVIEAQDYRGEPVLAAYTFLPQMQWGFVAKQDQQEIYAELNAMIRQMGLILLGSLLGVWLLAVIVARNLAQPISAMAGVAKTIEAGDLATRMPVHGTDEIAYLGQTINHMVDSLQIQITTRQGIAELNQVLAETGELKEFSQRLLKLLVALTDSQFGVCFSYQPDRNEFAPISWLGVNPEILRPFNAAEGEGELGRTLATQNITHLTDIPPDTRFTFRTFLGTALPKDLITIPIVINGRIIFLISLASLKSYLNHHLLIVQHVWINIGIALSNLLSHEATGRLAAELKDKNLELTAQAEELRIQQDDLLLQAQELEQQNIELEIQSKQVEEANRLKSEFLSNMSHELRTPLNAVLSLSKVLQAQTHDRLSAEEREYLEIINRNGKRLLALINDILDLSKIEAGMINLKVQKFSLVALIIDVMERLQPLADEKALILVKDIPDDLPFLESDELRLNQILQNVIGNAIKFTETGRITVSAREDGENFFLQVIDTGIGISPTELPHIFEAFWQADGSSTRRYEGTGLGLAIAHKTAQLLHGQLTIESSPGLGSTFTLTLPLAWPQDLAARPGGEKMPRPNSLKTLAAAAAPPAAAAAGLDSPAPILIIEDNAATVLQVKMVLENEGYSVDVAGGGPEALEYIQHTIPQGIILDLMMPGIDGFEVLEQMRSREATAGIPILILTAKDLTPADFNRLSANNIQQLLQKGEVDIIELISKVKHMLGHISRGEAPPGVTVNEQHPAPHRDTVKTAAPGRLKPPAEPSTILVIEDNPDNLKVIQAILQGRYRILTAPDGRTGLEQALSGQPDLILLDMALPIMDGFTLVRRLKAGDATRNIPVIALTARAMKGDREQIIQAGCNDYLAKPVDPDLLVNKIKEWLL